jgi:hypothetical protein
MRKQQKRKKRPVSPKAVLRLPDLDQAKSAVLNSLTSVDAQRGYRHAIDEFIDGTVQNLGCPSTAPLCSDTEYISNRVSLPLARSISDWVQCDGLLTKLPIADFSAPILLPAYGE